MKGKNSPKLPDDTDSLDSLREFYKRERTRKVRIDSPIKQFNRFLEENEYEIEDIGAKQAAEFAAYLRGEGLAEHTVSTYYSQLTVFVSWYQSRGVFDYNPFDIATDDRVEFNLPDTVKRHVELDDLRSYIKTIRDPSLLTFVVLLLKTGIRLAEAYNLDLRDINLDHPLSSSMPDVRAEIYGDSDVIYIDSTIEADEYNGETRERANKKNSTRILPIDSELKDTLVWYIAQIPPSPSPANPLFRQSRHNMGQRTSYTAHRNRFNRWAEEHGLRDRENKLNVSPHWCRHWFTTQLRQRMDNDNNEMRIGTVKGSVKSLRGDTDDDVIYIYTHNWGDNSWIKSVYQNNIPSLFTGISEGHYERMHPDQ